jgi:four helix bundle suffix protein
MGVRRGMVAGIARMFRILRMALSACCLRYREFVETRPGEVVANIAICLINQANYLIDQQLRRLEKDFVEQGGLRERMTRVRLEQRSKK